MKAVYFILVAFPLAAFSASEAIDGVPFQCVDRMRYELIRRFAAENRADRDGIAAYKEMVRSGPSYGCKERKNPNVENIAWCDGSGCTGAKATIRGGQCYVSGIWSGQDDQDIIDEAEHRQNCLVKAGPRR